MKDFLRENWFGRMPAIFGALLTISLLGNAYLLTQAGKSDLENNAFCAQFKEQASDRIRTYYATDDVVNVFPDEIFFSKNKGSCIALWSNTDTNPAGNGNTRTKVIFDPVTNEDIFSATFIYFFDEALNEGGQEVNANNLKQYQKILSEVKTQ